MAVKRIEAEPSTLVVELDHAALIIIDMQRDFLEPGGFGETLGNDVSLLQAAVAPLRKVLDAARAADMLVIHTREGHRPDLSDAPRHKVERGEPSLRIGAPGPMGRILVRGEPGHDIIPELYPAGGEPVIDKPGKGAFYQTDLELMLQEPRDRHAVRLRRHHRGLRQHHRARGQRPRLPLHRAVRLLRLLLPGIPRRRLGHDQGAGRHFRLGGGFAAIARGNGFALSNCARCAILTIKQSHRPPARSSRCPFNCRVRRKSLDLLAPRSRHGCRPTATCTASHLARGLRGRSRCV